MDDLLRNGDEIVGPFSMLDELPQDVTLVYYTYFGADLVLPQDLEFNLNPNYELVILSGQRDRYGAVLRMLKHCVSHGSPLIHHGGEVYPVAVGYVEIRLPHDAPEHNVLVLVATMECDNVCDG